MKCSVLCAALIEVLSFVLFVFLCLQTGLSVQVEVNKKKTECGIFFCEQKLSTLLDMVILQMEWDSVNS